MGSVLILDRRFWKAARDCTLRPVMVLVLTTPWQSRIVPRTESQLTSIDSSTRYELSSINEFELKSIDWYGKPGLVRWGENTEGTGSFAELSQTLWAFCKSRSYWPQEPSALNWRVGVECFYTPRRVAGAEWISSQAAGKYLDIRECTQLASSCVWLNSHYIRNL